MLKTYTVLLIFIFGTATYAQKKAVKIQVPTSIFSIANQVKSKNTSYQLNKTLGLGFFEFVKIDERIIDNGWFVLDYKNFGKVATTYIYEDFNMPNPEKHMFTGFDISDLIYQENCIRALP